MMLPTGYRRSRDCCSLDSRLSTDSFGDESIRSLDGAEAGLTASTLHNEKCNGFATGGLRRKRKLKSELVLVPEISISWSRLQH
jgi:hypothetical protein